MQGKLLGDSHQGDKFVLALLGCTQEDQHVGFKTLHSITSERQLLCYYCLGGTEQWGDKKKGSSHEDDFIRICKGRGQLSYMVWQVRLQWWTGLVDFYHFPSKTSFQVDGEGHFTCQYGEDRQQLLKRDIECCVAAMHAGARLVRVSHRDLTDERMACILDAALNNPLPHFILLS